MDTKVLGKARAQKVSEVDIIAVAIMQNELHEADWSVHEAREQLHHANATREHVVRKVIDYAVDRGHYHWLKLDTRAFNRE